MTKADWIAVDWGTSSLRAWAMSADGKVLGEARSDKGMGKLKPDEFEAALLELAEQWLGTTTTIIACGMVGAKQGWVEAAYRSVPGTPLGQPMTRAAAYDNRLNVQIIPGLKQIKPADVMRGEETQIAGFLHVEPKFDGVLCLPGTHTKWVHISAGEVVSFQTVMTGEMFALLAGQSVLRHSVAVDGLDENALSQAVSDTLARPETVGARMFSIRAEGLLTGLSPVVARSRLSGMLIGAELAATRPFWLGREVVLIGDGKLSRIYKLALGLQGVEARIADGTDVTLNGLRAAYAMQRVMN
jgi:2-dehydro-3-deoxygalactonokinase